MVDRFLRRLFAAVWLGHLPVTDPQLGEIPRTLLYAVLPKGAHWVPRRELARPEGEEAPFDPSDDDPIWQALADLEPNAYATDWRHRYLDSQRVERDQVLAWCNAHRWRPPAIWSRDKMSRRPPGRPTMRSRYEEEFHQLVAAGELPRQKREAARLIRKRILEQDPGAQPGMVDTIERAIAHLFKSHGRQKRHAAQPSRRKKSQPT